MVLDPSPQRPVSLGNLSGGGRRRSVIAITSRPPGRQGRRPSCYDLPSFSRQHSVHTYTEAPHPGLLAPGQLRQSKPRGLEVPGGLHTRRASETLELPPL